MNDYQREMVRLKAKYSSKLQYVLSSLIPYTEANLKLAFKPNLFFNDLDKLDIIKKSVAKATYYRALKKNLIRIDDSGNPRLTAAGQRKLKKYQPAKLGNKAKLILIFDIPEIERGKRSQLRILLKELKFWQVQLSVWCSNHDSREYLKQELAYLNIKDKVKIYEALELP